MYKYKFLKNCGVNLLFESKYHIDDIIPVIFSDGTTFIRFEDNEMVVKLSEIKDVEIDGVKYQIRSYAN